MESLGAAQSPASVGAHLPSLARVEACTGSLEAKQFSFTWRVLEHAFCSSEILKARLAGQGKAVFFCLARVPAAGVEKGFIQSDQG